MQRRQTFRPEMERQCFMSEAYSNFFQGGHHIVTSFISVCFSGGVSLKQSEEKRL